MQALAKHKMTVDEFLAWADDLDGDERYELEHGEPVLMAPGTMRHVRAIASTFGALRDAIKKAGLRCESIIDGPGVKIDEYRCYIPDVSVNCGPRVPDDVRFVPNPVIVVEVLSPSTRRLDKLRKIGGYFGLPAVQHYIIIDVKDRVALHQRRSGETEIVTSFVREGELRLDPPGLVIAVADMFGDE